MEIKKVYIREILSKIIESDIKELSVSPLRGDASDRRYFRITCDSTTMSRKIRSVIMMRLADPQIKKELPYIDILNHLERCGVDVPHLFFYDKVRGLLFIEDLGSLTLEEVVKGKDVDVQRRYYKKAIDTLLTIQIEGSKKERGDCIAFRLCFDVKKFMWELDFMLEHMVEGLLNKSIQEKDRKEIRDHFLKICMILSDQERCFTHRDYHSRNIMVVNGKLKILDFQDARMGPCQYDLASLLRDSYIVLDDELFEDLFEYYIHRKEEIEDTYIDRIEFRRIFDYMSIQRNLKALGTFAYQKVVRNNGRYLESMPPTINYVRSNLIKYPEFMGLRGVLYKYIEVRGEDYGKI